MSYSSKISFGRVSSSCVNSKSENLSANKFEYPEGNMNNILSKKEKQEIIDRFPSLTPKLPPLYSDIGYKYDVTYLPNTDTVVINNKNVTNHTVSINKEGKAISVGSWHRTELDGDYKDIVEKVKEKYETSVNNPKPMQELDSLAILGKSQVK